MKVQAINGAYNHYEQATAVSNGTDFRQLLTTTTEDASVEAQQDVKKLSFRDMIDVEHKAIVAFRQGDLIGHAQYMQQLRGYEGAVERVNDIVAAQTTDSGIFPYDAPQSVQHYVSGLSLKERMTMFTQVGVQKVMANVYEDASGKWRVQQPGDAQYIDLFEQPDFSYETLIENMLAQIEFNRKYSTEEDYKHQLQVILGLKNAIA